MKKPGFTILFLLLMILQVLLMQFFTFSRFVMVSFLPVMILCIPIEKGTIFSMIVAFVTGLAVDFLGTECWDSRPFRWSRSRFAAWA